MRTSSDVGVRTMGLLLAVILLVFGIILFIGGSWGTHRPTPGRSQKEIVCGRYGTCTTR